MNMRLSLLALLAVVPMAMTYQLPARSVTVRSGASRGSWALCAAGATVSTTCILKAEQTNAQLYRPLRAPSAARAPTSSNSSRP